MNEIFIYSYFLCCILRFIDELYLFEWIFIYFTFSKSHNKLWIDLFFMWWLYWSFVAYTMDTFLELLNKTLSKWFLFVVVVASILNGKAMKMEVYWYTMKFSRMILNQYHRLPASKLFYCLCFGFSQFKINILSIRSKVMNNKFEFDLKCY